MKKTLAIFMTCLLMFGLACCGSTGNTDGEPSSTSVDVQTSAPGDDADAQGVSASSLVQTEPQPAGKKALVVYFSATGNTKAVAETLAAMQNADLYEIVPEQPYTAGDLNYNDRSSRATAEQNNENARPAISGSVENIADYDVIYVGFPIWWGDMPRILFTFFDSYDLSGKTIAPFCTSGGSGISGAVNSIEELEPGATVTNGLKAGTLNAENDLEQWLSSISLAE